MANENNKIDQEELDRLEDELLEEEARAREEKMKVEGKSVFDLERLKNEGTKGLKNKDNEDRK